MFGVAVAAISRQNTLRAESCEVNESNSTAQPSLAVIIIFHSGIQALADGSQGSLGMEGHGQCWGINLVINGRGEHFLINVHFFILLDWDQNKSSRNFFYNSENTYILESRSFR